jgi:hypothetical protein
LYSVVLQTGLLSCIDPSVRKVTKSPKVGPLLIFSISLGSFNIAVENWLIPAPVALKISDPGKLRRCKKYLNLTLTYSFEVCIYYFVVIWYINTYNVVEDIVLS